MMLGISERDIITAVLNLLGAHHPSLPHISSGWRGAVSSRKTYTGMLSQTTSNTPTLLFSNGGFSINWVKIIPSAENGLLFYSLHSRLTKWIHPNKFSLSAIEETCAGNYPPNSNQWAPSSTHEEHPVCDVSIPWGWSFVFFFFHFISC